MVDYELKNNTYLITPKDNPKDRIDIEIGDIKQPDFHPQVKHKRWDNECNVSYRLIHEELNPTVIEEDGKIKWKGKDIEVDFYELTEGEGGYEMEVILNKKPKTNVVSFTLQDKDVEYLYQHELTQKEKDDGASQPENVICSYAVYAKKQKINWVGGKEYKVGKIGHIYRPKIIDSDGKEVWGDLHIENGILTVTIPQEFLNTAVYPVKHTAGLTFGYNSTGSSSVNFATNGAVGSFLNISVSISGVVNSITLHWNAPSGGATFKFFIVNASTLAIISNSISSAITLVTFDGDTSPHTFNYVTKPVVSLGTTYSPWIVSGSNTAVRRDTGGSSGDSKFENDNNFSSPTNPTPSNSSSRYSIYATYTESGPTNTITMSAGSFTLTGNIIDLLKSSILALAKGTFVLTGVSVGLLRSLILTLASGTYTLTGNAVSLLRKLVITLAKGTFTLSGNSVNLLRRFILTLSKGTFTLTGKSVSLLKTNVLKAIRGVYTLTGNDITLKSSKIWTALSKSATTFTNKVKNSTTFTGESKNSTSFTNKTKNTTSFTNKSKSSTNWTNDTLN